MGTLLMNRKQQISLASVILAGFFATGCSQQQIQEEPVVATPKPAPVVVKPAPVVMRPAPVVTRPAPTRPAPRPRNPNCHSHPSNSMTKSIQHCHKNPRGKHSYGKKVMVRHAPAVRQQQPRPQVDVYALQRKLKAKGYYKGAIDGVVGNQTRDALKRFQNR